MIPTDYKHIFRTAFGLPPDKNDTPICGADLLDSWSAAGKPECPKCNNLAYAIKLRGFSTDASDQATECSKRGDYEGSFYARGLRDAYATAAAFLP